MDERISITALRARNLSRLHLVFAPTAFLEIHTTPGGSPDAVTPTVARTRNPVWTKFTHVHACRNLCGPVTVGFVVRDVSGGPVLGRAVLSVDAALVEGWFALRPDGVPPGTISSSPAELYVRITRPTYCWRRRMDCGRALPLPELQGVGKDVKGELRSVAPQPGLLFRCGELVVSAEARGVPTAAKDLHVDLRTEEQSVRGFETAESRAAWTAHLELERCRTDAAGANAAAAAAQCAERDEALRANAPVAGQDAVNGEDGDSKNHPSVSAVMKSSAKAVGNRTLGLTTLHMETLAPSIELPRIVKAAGNYALGLASVHSEDAKAARHAEGSHAGSREVSAEDTGSVSAKDTITTSTLKNDDQPPSKNKVSAKVDVIVQTDSVEPTKDGENKDHDCDNSVGNVDVDNGGNADDDNDDDDNNAIDKEDNDCGNGGDNDDESGADDDEGFMEFDSGDEHKEDVDSKHGQDQSVGHPRRTVDFGSFRFALLQGFLPGMLQIMMQDKASPLPPPLKMLQEHRIKIPQLTRFLCSCSKRCNTHLFKMRLTGSGAENAKIAIYLTIAYRSWTPKATFTDVTGRFRNIFANPDRPAVELMSRFPEAKNLVYLFVGGLFTTHYPTYFEKNVGYLKNKLHFPYVDSVGIHTEGSIERNARIIRDSVAKKSRGQKSVVLIGHSKGSIDAISVLQRHPDTAPQLFGIISFQGPFGGTYLIDYLYRSKLAVTAISSFIESVWKGDQAAVADMSYSARLRSFGLPLDYIESSEKMSGAKKKKSEQSLHQTLDPSVFEVEKWKHCVPDNLLDNLRSVPIVAFASSASFDLLRIRNAATAAGFASMAPLAQVIVQNTGFACDGLIIPVDGIVPYADVAALNDMMHTEPALFVKGTKYPPGKLTACAILLLFEKAKREANAATSTA